MTKKKVTKKDPSRFLKGKPLRWGNLVITQVEKLDDRSDCEGLTIEKLKEAKEAMQGYESKPSTYKLTLYEPVMPRTKKRRIRNKWYKDISKWRVIRTSNGY